MHGSAEKYRSSPPRLPFAFLIILALLSAGMGERAHALACGIRATRTTEVAAPTAIRLECDAPLGARVAWEFGDGATLDYGAAAEVSHVFSAPGSYTVFARIEGEEVPASTLITVLNAVAPVPPERSGTLLLDSRRGRLWTVNVDNHSVTVISTAALARIKEIPVGRSPRTLAQDAEGRIWVANQDDASLTVVDGDRLVTIRTIRLPRASRPYGVCFDPGRHNLYVTLEAVGAVLRIDPGTGRILDSLPVFPTPRGIAVAPDGRSLWISRYISPADHGEIAELAAAPFRVRRIIDLAYDHTQDTESGGRGVPNAIASLTISPDGLRAWVPFKKDNVRRGLFADPMGPQLPTFESTVRTAIAQIDLATGVEVPGIRIDLDNRSMACAVAFAQGGAFAFVATETSNEIAVINAVENIRATAIEPREKGHELGPDGLQVSADDSLVYIHDFLSREVAVYAIGEVGGSNLMPRRALIPTVERETLTPEVLLGKQIFYDAADPRMARDKYLSCAVCHLDGGSDARVWDFTHKGEGLRRTTSLLGKAGMGQGPLHWSANFDEVQDFEHDMRDAFLGTGFLDDAVFNQGARNLPLGDRKAGLSPDLDALAAYVASLDRAHPSPFRNADGTLTVEAKEGEIIFNRKEVGCTDCHVPPLYTDSRLLPDPGATVATRSSVTAQGFLLHDVGTLNAGSGHRMGDTLTGFDTPTLKGVWESGPYLHDGSAATLMDVITAANPEDRHGRTSGLSILERKQLVAFLMQLDDGDAPAGIRDPDRRIGHGRKLLVTAENVGAGIRFSGIGGPEGARPMVEIRGLSGRLERILGPMRGDVTETAWSLFWDGRERTGSVCAPGLYLVRARQGPQSAATTVTWIP